MQAEVSRILTWSCVDGPGNRFVLFLQGCNFNCLACHNPHTMGRCNDCGDCLDVCPTPALSLVDGKMRFDATQCTKCDACLDACPINANPMLATYSVDDMLALIREHAGFVSGITVSGGEPTMQLPFIVELFRRMGEDAGLRHLTRFIDTNGFLGPSGWNAVLDVTDGVMLDIKAFDPARHHRLTGKDNARVLQSARRLHAAGKLHELRYLMIPGETDREEELAALQAFALSLGGSVRLRLNAFRNHGVKGIASAWPPMEKQALEQAAATLAAAGIGPIITPTVYV